MIEYTFWAGWKAMAHRVDGIFVVDKPAGMTSRVALNKVWQWLPRGTRIGHAGTLDPMATGVLVACVGRGTRLVEWVQDLQKVYRADIRFGASSSTDDAEGEITELPVPADPGQQALQETLQRFTGTIQQVPSAVSAVKVDGVRAYKLARRGEEPVLQARPVRIDSIELLEAEWPRIRLRVECGKGTYIRSLARDLGRTLGTGAHLTALCRERVGVFGLEEALPLTTPREEALSRMQPLARAVESLPRVEFSGEALDRMLCGQKPTREELRSYGAELPEIPEGTILAVLEGGKLKILAQWLEGRLRPRKAFLGEESLTGDGIGGER